MGIFSIFKKKSAKIDMEHLPNHLAFIMDGNRRWARSRGLPTLLGHREGVEALKRVVRRAKELGIKNLSFYCFSTERGCFFWFQGTGLFHILFLLMEAHFPAAQGQTEGKGIQST